jgi:hypothetical protein
MQKRDCVPSKKYFIYGGSVWQWRKNKEQFLSASFTKRAFGGPNTGHHEDMGRQSYVCARELY